MKQKLGLLAFLIFVCSFNGEATDTLKIVRPISIQNINGSIENEMYAIRQKNILVPYSEQFGMASAFSWILHTGISKELSKLNLFHFENCFFNVYKNPYNNIRNEKFPFGLQFTSCHLRYLTLRDISGNIQFINDTIHTLELSSITNSNIEFRGNPFIKTIVLYNSNNIGLNFQGNIYSDTATIDIRNSAINHIDFFFEQSKRSEYTFAMDSIYNYIISPFDSCALSDRECKYTFYKCFIDATLYSLGKCNQSTISFIDCVFGDHANLEDLGAQNIRFINCRTTSNQLPLSFLNDSTQIKLDFTNSDISNWKFDFPKNGKLVFDSIAARTIDSRFNTYEKLLEKFKKEGKQESYKNVDIQYRQLKNNKLWNFVDRYWWNYGYDKSYVIKWILFFLAIFTIVNLLFWKEIITVYPLINSISPSYYEKTHRNWKQVFRTIVRTLVFTSFIFFSIHISFDKLSYNKTRWLLWFLFQYIIGLICLFFVLNFLLKS